MASEDDGELKLIDLFCGAGGAAEGFMEAGFDVALGTDINKHSLETYHNNLWARTLHYDLFEAKPNKILEAACLAEWETSVLLGCPPCQGFSTLGNNPIDDDRNELVNRFVDIVKDVMPVFIAFENVPGLAEHDQYYGRMLRRLKRLGYRTEPRIVDMRDYGVPQRRKRLVTVGCSCDELWEHFTFPRPTHSENPEAIGLQKWRTVRDAISNLPSLEAGQRSTIPNHEAGSHSDRIMEKIRCIPKNGGSRRDLPKSLWYPCHLKNRGFNDILGRMRWDEPSPTITTGCINPTKGRFLHPEQDRAISIREAARLQTFPDRYIFMCGREEAARQIGNALPPRFAKILGDSISAAFRESNM